MMHSLISSFVFLKNYEQIWKIVGETRVQWVIIFELFCLQNSLIVGVQLQVSGKVGSLVGSFLGGQCSAFPTTVEFYRKASCRGRNKNADENARKILLLKRHYESVLISFA